MQVEFLSKFSKDLDGINLKSVKSNLVRIIRIIESTDNLNTIPSLKKLAGHKSAFRISDYRVGIFYENHTVIFARIVHREDIYKVFP
jgi:mRNA interferase RelE/StbE